MSDLKINLQEILQEKQEKIIPENIKKDVQIFDVVGTLEGETTASGVKLFETEEEMQADSTAKEGDLAVVYRDETQNMTADTQTQYITFPETIVLPEAFTDDVYCGLRAVDESAMFDGQSQLSQSMFSFSGYSETGMISVMYESSDGITYTRQEFMGDSGDLTNPVDLGTSVKVYNSEEWNDNFGYFMQTGGNVFDGLYEYKTHYVDDNLIHFILIPSITFDVQDNSINNVNFDYTDISYDVNKIDICLNKMKTDGIFTKVFPSKLYAGTDGCLYVYIDTTGFNCGIGYDEDKSCLGFIGSVAQDCILDVYKLDLENGAYEKSEPITFSDTVLNYSSIILRVANTNNINTVPVNCSGNGISTYTNLSLYCKNSNNSIEYLEDSIDCRITSDVYINAPNQYTLISSNQLLPNISAYGKNGNVVGDGSIMTPNNTFTDIPAMLYYNIQKHYDEMEPRILTDEDKEIDINIHFIPVKSDGTPLLNTSDVTDMSDMFFDCSSLTTIPLLDTSNVTNMSNMFFNCSSLTTIPLLDTSGVTIMSGMFTGCSSLTTISLLDTSGVTIINHMFNGCSNLTAIPLLDTSSATNMNSMFYSCSSLTTIPLLDTSSATNMRNMFDGCSNLTTIPLLDTSSVTDIRRMFSGCSNLTNETLSNILQMLINATSYTNTKTLNYIGLSREQATTCATLSNWAACESAGWTTGY